MKNSIQKGFTLIELLVVIAIIGILAGILFVAINPSDKINDAEDSKIESSLAGIPTQAFIVYDSASPTRSYAGVCSDTTVSQVITGLGADCFDIDGSYAAGKLLSDDTSYYCVDSSGYRGILSADPTLSDTNTTCN